MKIASQRFYLSLTGYNWSAISNHSLNRTGIDTPQLLAAFFAGDENWQEHSVQVNPSEDAARSYILYVPASYDPSTPTPVVLSLHGRTVNAFSQARSSGFNAVAEEYGFIVVYPQAFDLFYDNPERADAVWNYTLHTPLPGPHQEDDDIFLDRIVDDLAQTLNVDMNRLYVNGLSNGGYMVNHLACTRSDRYAAFASVAANAPYGIHLSATVITIPALPFSSIMVRAMLFLPGKAHRDKTGKLESKFIS